jgi:putative DNA primase/helicase
VFKDARPTDHKGATDFNDLQALEGGPAIVGAQVAAKLRQLGWPAGGNVVALTSTSGRGGDGEPPDDGPIRFDLDVLLQHFTLVLTTDTAFDGRDRVLWGLGPLRSAAGKSLVRMWLEHPQRRAVWPEQVGFDPAGTNPHVLCNLWGGWPTSPKKGRCDALLRILEHLCSREDKPREVYNWVLKWVAYPMQHPGAKMQTALLMHGPEGTGKNTFFGAVRNAYDQYGFTFTQVELESQFNGIFSGKLFGIGNEVVSRAELYHQQGRMRNMITEGEWPINEKNMPARMEQNHCNMVFFSNRIDIAKLDPDDRRYCVVWTPGPAPPELYLEAKEELANGGSAALHWYLLNEVDTEGFDEHSKPPMTRAKRDLIGLGMDSTERFWREWSAPDGELRDLYMPCTSAQLYQAYQLYCRRLGIGKPAQQDTLSTVLGKKPGIKLDRCEARVGGAKRQHRVVLISGLHDPPDHFDGPRIDWMTGCIEEFAKTFERMQLDGVLPLGGAGQAGRGAREDAPTKPKKTLTEEEAAAIGIGLP